MTSQQPPNFGEKEAAALLEAGWRQGEVLRGTPPLLADSFFIICTQSCSVVSSDLVRDPFVELAEAKPIQRYHQKGAEARGKNVRKFHIPVGDAEFAALEVNINSRHFVKREQFLQLQPAGISVSDHARREFAGWIARYYTRVALPNELVSRLRKTAYPKLKGFLEAKDGNPPAMRHESIVSMWIRFEPDSEIGIAADYSVDILMLCDKPETSDAFDEHLKTLFGTRQFTMDGIDFRIVVNTPEETLLSDLQGWDRFSDWDHLSGMWETATVPGAR